MIKYRGFIAVVPCDIYNLLYECVHVPFADIWGV